MDVHQALVGVNLLVSTSLISPTFAPLGGIAAAAIRQNTPTAFVNVAVIPMDREQILTDQTVIVQGDRIVALGPAAQIRVPADAMRIDGHGQFLIPGLADMHTHVSMPGSPIPDSVAEAKLFGYLADGVTTLRLMGGHPTQLAWRAHAAKGEWVSPRLYVAGPMIILPPEGGATALVTLVEEQKAAGYDLIKLHTDLPHESFDSLVAAARRAGLPIAADLGVLSGTMNTSGVPEALASHLASIEHLSQYLEAASASPHQPGAIVDSEYVLTVVRGVDSLRIRRLAVATQQAGVWNVPTLVAYEYRNKVFRRPGSDFTPTQVREQQAIWQFNRQMLQALHAAGAGLLVGTDIDATYGRVDYGIAVHEELALFVAAGLTPYQALEAGTRNVAHYFGTLDSTGTIAVGKRADLVLLEANPLVDIRATQQQAGVMLGGRWFSRAELAARRAVLDPWYKTKVQPYARIPLSAAPLSTWGPPWPATP